MSKFEEFNNVDNSMVGSEISIDYNKATAKKTGNTQVYEAGKSYYSYINNIKSEEFDENSDYCTVFMIL